MTTCAMAQTIDGIFKTVLKRLKHCLRRSSSHRHTVTAAALAFYSLISLVPILITGVSIAAWLVDEETAKASLLDGTSSVAGTNVSNYFAELLNKDIQWTGSGLSPIIGAVFLIFSATMMLGELRSCLTRIFGPLEQPKTVVKNRARTMAIQRIVNRGVAVVLLLFIGLFIASLVVFQTVLGLMMSYTGDDILPPWLIGMVAPVFSFLAIAVLCSVAIRWLPKNPPTFKIALQGGAVSTILLAALKVGLSLVLKYADVGSYYGSSLTLVLVLFWIYFAMQAFLFGAEYAAGLTREEHLETTKSTPV